MGVWVRQLFYLLAEDGRDLAHHHITLFCELNQLSGKHLSNLDGSFSACPCIASQLFD